MTIWCTGIFSPVFSNSNESYLISNSILHKIYSLVCHQESSKSFFISGHKLEVCARCAGIYLGGLLISVPALIFPGLKFRSRKPLFLSMIFMAADVILNTAGVYQYSKLTALITGLILGSVSILYIFNSIEEYFSEEIIYSNVQ